MRAYRICGQHEVKIMKGHVAKDHVQFWGRHLWARGYFCCRSGNVTDEVIAKYIADQNIDQDEDFRVDG